MEPGKYLLSSLGTVFTALYAAGGPTQNGSLRRIRLMRGGGCEDDAVGAHDGGDPDQDAAGAAHRLRSSRSRTIAARSSGMPPPLREDVTNTSGNAAGCFASAAIVSAMRVCNSAAFT